MDIIPYSDDMLDKLAALDQQCFQRTEARSHTNIANLVAISNKGTLVCVDKAEILGYVFTHCYGKVGTIGPIGCMEEHRNKGIGKRLLAEAISLLQGKACHQIGLEVLPSKGSNLTFYLKSGFDFVEPTLQMRIDSLVSRVDEDRVIDADRVLWDDIERFLASNMDVAGFSLLDDVTFSLQQKAPVKVYCSHNGDIEGIMIYHQELYPFLYGAVFSRETKNVTFSLFTTFKRIFPASVLRFRVNACYQRYKQFVCSSIPIEQQIVRMELTGYKGRHEHTDGLVLRSWIG